MVTLLQRSTRPRCRVGLACGFLLLVACSGGERQVSGPGGDDSDDVSKTSLSVQVRVDPADVELARALGWEDGVPGAEVFLLRNGTREWIPATTNGDGEAVYEDVLNGLYRIYARHTLTENEAGATDGVIRAFGDGRTFHVSSDQRDIQLELFADRAQGLVISEIGFGLPPPWVVENLVSKAGLYIEFYNNSDRTIRLDGLVFGPAAGFTSDAFNPCSFTEPVRTDPEGVYFRIALAFPGSGGEHPLGPGETALVAMVAGDHREIHPSMPDLSGADFEISGPGLADNPAVPNMRDVGIESIHAPVNWQRLRGIRDPYFISDPIDPPSMPIMWRDKRGNGFVRVAADRLHEVIISSNVWPDSDIEFPPCIQIIHPRFDRYEMLRDIGFDVDSNEQAFKSLVRRVLRTEGGRLILQNTNTSRVDFFVGTKTPGWIERR